MPRRLIPDVVHDQTLLVLPATATVREAALRMRERHIGAVLVGGDRLEGIFTERDMVNRVVADARDPDHTRLEEVMTKDPHTITPEASAIAALRMMQDGGYRHLPIVAGGRLVGIVSRRDLTGAEKARLEEETGYFERL